MNIADFINAALPWVAMAVLLAVYAVISSKDRSDDGEAES